MIRRISTLVVFYLGWIVVAQANTSAITPTNIQQVYQKLTEAVGDQSSDLPKVVVRPQKRFGASYRRSENTIFIEQAAIDVCASFGSDADAALAFLLGHELTHYYQKHDWQEVGFTSFIAAQDVFQKNIHHEKEADTYSAFIAHLAGYNSVKIIPALLEKIYETYELHGKTLVAYPPLEKRQAVAKEVCKTVQGLIDIYQAGNYMYALGKYDEALASYEYLLQYVKFKELYNNIGLCALYAAIPFTQQEHSFVYPLTLDPSSPLRAPSGITKKELMQRAITAFAKAAKYDNQYFTSYLNLICAYDLSGNYPQAKKLLTEIIPLATSKAAQQKVQIMAAISAFRNRKKDQAIKILQAILYNQPLPELVQIASHNLKVLKGEASYRPTLVAHQPMVEERIEGISLLFYKNEKNDAKYLLKNKILDQKWVSVAALPFSKVFNFFANDRVTKLQLTSAKSLVTKKGIGVQSTLQEIQSKYKDSPQKITPLPDGFLLVLPKNGLFFQIDDQERVTAWGVFVD